MVVGLLVVVLVASLLLLYKRLVSLLMVLCLISLDDDIAWFVSVVPSLQ